MFCRGKYTPRDSQYFVEKQREKSRKEEDKKTKAFKDTGLWRGLLILTLFQNNLLAILLLLIISRL